MRKLLAGVVQVCAALATAACNWSPTSPGLRAGAEPMLELAGDPPVFVRSVKVLVGTLSHADALAGLKQALSHLQQAAKQSASKGKRSGGSFVANFVTEPDGMIRMMTEAKVRLPEEVVEGLVGSTMSNKWRFPASGGKSIIEVKFVVGML